MDAGEAKIDAAPVGKGAPKKGNKGDTHTHTHGDGKAPKPGKVAALAAAAPPQSQRAEHGASLWLVSLVGAVATLVRDDIDTFRVAFLVLVAGGEGGGF